MAAQIGELKLLPTEEKETTEEYRNQPIYHYEQTVKRELNHTLNSLNSIVEYCNANGISKENIHIHLNVIVENTMMAPTRQEETRTWQEDNYFLRYRRQAYDKESTTSSSDEAHSPSSKGESPEDRKQRQLAT